MFQLIRKHQYGIMLVVAIIVIIAFTFLYDPNRDATSQAAKPEISMFGKSFGPRQTDRIRRSQRLIYSLGLFDLFELSTLDKRYGTVNNQRDENQFDYVFNTLLLENEIDRLGVQPSDFEIEERIKTIRSFQTNGSYDATKWENFETFAATQGFNRPAIFKLVGKEIALKKLKALITSGITASPHEIEQVFNAQNAKLFASTITVPKDSITIEEEITDEQIQTYYSENKESFRSEPTRAISYIRFTRPVREAAPPVPEQTGEEPPEETKPTGESEEDFKKRERAFAENVKTFADRIVSTEETQTFEEIAKEETFAAYSGSLVTTPLFKRSEAPEEIKSENQLLDQAFAATEESPLGDPVKVSDGFYFYKVTEIAEQVHRPLEEVKEEIGGTLKDQKIAEALDTATREVREKIQAAIAEGKSVTEAAKEAGYETREVPMFTSNQPPRAVADGAKIATAVKDLNPGSLSEPQEVSTGLMLVHLSSRERPLDADDARKKAVATQVEAAQRKTAFEAWFASRKELAQPKTLIQPPSA